MANEATVFGAQLPLKRWRWCRRLALFFSSLLRCLLLSDGCFCVVVVPLRSSLCFFFSSSSRKSAKERETRANKSMHVNLERKRRDVCFWSSVDDFFLLLRFTPAVCFFWKRRETNQQHERGGVEGLLQIYIYITRGNELRCMYCVRVCRYILLYKEGWWSDGTTRKSDVFVLSAPKKKKGAKTKRDK